MSYRFPLLFSGIFGLTGTILGALGAHGPLRVLLDQRGSHENWETAVQYQLVHALALLAAGVWLRISEANGAPRAIVWAARSWVAGTVLFSGTIFLLAVGGPKFLGPFTPLGGVCLMLGWASLIAAAFHAGPADRR
jgi:uncharacterized membrane protein YgdD (TMEM256/DUF423 family)